MRTAVKIAAEISDSDEETCTSMFRDVMRIRQQLYATATDVAKSLGLTSSEMALVDTLGKYGPLTMGQLAELSFISPPNTSYTARSLEDRDLIQRERSAESNRVVNVRLTPNGEKIFKQSYPRVVGAVNEYLQSRINSKDRQSLVKLLRKLAE